MTDFGKLVGLHKHWITADAINHHLRRSNAGSPEAALSELPEGIQELGNLMSMLSVLTVWYSLLCRSGRLSRA